MAAYDTDPPELGSIKIRLPNAGSGGVEFDHFLSYDYHEDYLIPVDAGRFTLDVDELSTSDLQALAPGAKVEVTIADLPQTVGWLDTVRIRSNRSGGAVADIEFRNWLSPAIDAQVDPQTRFAPSMTLLDMLTAVFKPFGVAVFSESNDANRNAITGQKYGTPTSKKGKPLKSYVLHQQKPYPNEGAFAFASRISQRFGLWIRPGADGKSIVVCKPDFDQQPSYAIHHKTDDSAIYNNVIESEVQKSRLDQPSIIFAYGFGGGGEFAKATLKGGIINPVVVTDNSEIVAAYPSVSFKTAEVPAIASGIATVMYDPMARPLYLCDREAHTQSELDAFIRRELSLRMRKALFAVYTFEGHRLGGVPLAVDTIISVDDDRSNLHTPLWIQGRRFRKSPTEGTRTTIECILPGSLQF